MADGPFSWAIGLDQSKIEAALEWAATGPHEGEPFIDPNLAPGGMVFQVWCMGTMMLERRVPEERALELVERQGARDAAMANELLEQHGVVELRSFDGDTGAWIHTRIFGLGPHHG